MRLSQNQKKKLLQLDGVKGVSAQGDEVILYTDKAHLRSYATVDGMKVRTVLAAKDDETVIKMSLVTTTKQLRKEKWRPIPGGVSAANIDCTAGTVGMRVFRHGEAMLLSNTHIFGQKTGIEILQPSPADGGTDADKVGYLDDFVPINYEETGIVNDVDAAVAYAEPLSDNILDIGVIQEFADPRVLLPVVKSGRNGFSRGVVIGTDGMFKVEYGRGDNIRSAIFDGVTITSHMGDPGDSGSVLVSGDKAVGLLFAGSSIVTLFIPMAKALRRLKLSLV